MPAKSKTQQKLMAIAKYSPEKVFPENKAATKMSGKSLSDFASTSLKGLPARVKDSKNVLAKIAGGKGSKELQGLAKRRKK
jgi:hypothetical protein